MLVLVRLDLAEVLELLRGIRNDGAISWLPIGGTNFVVGVGPLEGLDKTQSLVHRPTNRQIIHGCNY